MDEAHEFGIGDQIKKQNFHFHSSEACSNSGLELAPDLAHEVAHRLSWFGEARPDGAVGSKTLAPRTTHELVGGQTQLLARQVVERNVDGRNGMQPDTAAAWPE